MAIRRKQFHLQLVNTRTKLPIDDDTGSFQVYTAGSPVRLSITDAAGATATQEVALGAFVSRTMTDGQLNFYTAISVTQVDISVLTAKGRSYFLKGINVSRQRVDVDPERSDYTLVVAINDKASSTTLRQLGFQAKKGMVISDVYAKVTSAFRGALTANNMINVGIAGDSDAFAKNLLIQTTGYKQILVHSTTGKIFATQFAGVELANWDTASFQTVLGWFSRKKYFVPTATQLCVAKAVALTGTMTGTAAAGGKAYLFFKYELDPTGSATDN